MRRGRLVLPLIVFVWAGVARAGLDGSVYLVPINTSFESHGECAYVNALKQIDGSVVLSGTHRVTGPQVFEHPVSGNGRYSYILQGPASPGSCYGTSLHAIADPPGLFNTQEQTWTGDTRCAPAPPPTSPPPTEERCEPDQWGNCSPILIDLGRGGYALSGEDDPVAFDIDADGSPNRITWTARGSATALLAMDRNHNQIIDDGSELFGNWTRLASGTRAGNGFEALKDLDANHDGLVSALDERWPALLVWTDANHDGISQSQEMQRIAVTAIRAIDTDYHWTGRRDSQGNLFRYQGTAKRESGGQAIYDVYFRSVP